MQEKSQAISGFLKSLVAEGIVLLLIIAVLVLLFCVITRKLKGRKNIIYKARLLLLLFAALVCLKLVMLIPAWIDVYTDTIEVIEVTKYTCSYHNQPQFTLNPYGTTVHFTTADGTSFYGYLLEEFDISDEGHGSILYAKHSHYILDAVLLPDD